MDPETLDLIRRGHEVFGTPAASPQLHGGSAAELDRRLGRNSEMPVGGGQQVYAADLAESRSAIRAAVANDDELRKAIAQVVAEHERFHRESRKVLDAAMADADPAADTPMGQREAARRRAAYLRTQRDILRGARAHSKKSAAALRALRYRRTGRWRPGMAVDPELLRRIPPGPGREAVKHALSQLGVPYAWGGTAWGRGIDCSALTQGAWARAGVHIDRDTWHQIHNGAAVSRSEMAPGDLVFPYSKKDPGGHVQMYIGGGKVVEAPYTGATVRIANLPAEIMAIRRPY